LARIEPPGQYVKEYRELQLQIEKRCDRSSLHFIIVAFEQFLEDNCIEDGSLYWQLFTFRRFINKQEACRRLGLEPEALDALVAVGKLETFHPVIDSAEVLVDTQSIMRLKKELM